MNVTTFVKSMDGNLAEITRLRDFFIEQTATLKNSSEAIELPPERHQQIRRSLVERQQLIEWAGLSISALRGFTAQVVTVAELETDLAAEFTAAATLENL